MIKAACRNSRSRGGLKTHSGSTQSEIRRGGRREDEDHDKDKLDEKRANWRRYSETVRRNKEIRTDGGGRRRRATESITERKRRSGREMWAEISEKE